MNLRGSEWLILLLIVLLLFGARRLPDMARGLGRSLRIFKAETKGLMNDDDASKATAASATDAAAAAPADRVETAPRDPAEPTDR